MSDGSCHDIRLKLQAFRGRALDLAVLQVECWAKTQPVPCIPSGRLKHGCGNDLSGVLYVQYELKKKGPRLLTHDIDRLSPEPFYLQLSRMVEQAIDSGEFRAGDRLPGESEFCRRYDLARSTVREMLRNLQERGRVKMIPRRGAFVVDPEQSGWSLQVTTGFFEGEVDHNRRKVETTVLEARRCDFPQVAASALHLARGEQGFRLHRLRRLDGALALYSENFMLPELEDVVRNSEVMAPHGSLNRVLRGAGYAVFGARRSVEAVPATAKLAKLLDVPAKSPLLFVTSVSWGKDQRPFDYYTSWVKTDVVPITVEAQAVLDTH